MAKQRAEGVVLSQPTTLPRAVTERLLADSDAIARRMTRRLAAEIGLPAGDGYGRVTYLRLVMRACRDGLRALLRQLHDGRRAHPAELAALGAAGARQAEMGVPLEVLLHGYRVAARVVWQEVVDESVRLGELSPPTVVAVTEQVLEYLDSISGAVGHAYLETRERLLRRRDRDRDQVLARLLAGDASDDLLRLAAASGVELAPPYRVLAVGTDGTDAERRLIEVWQQHRPLVAGGDGVVALVDPGASLERLAEVAEQALGAPLRLGIGPVVGGLTEVRDAAKRARTALSVGARLHPARRLHDHAELGVFAAAGASKEDLALFVDGALDPLLTPARGDLRETLEAVLGTGSLAEAAETLGVHRHTVVYRLGRISELIGADLDDAPTRHLLWLALRLDRLRSD